MMSAPSSWWPYAAREGFVNVCRAKFGEFVVFDDVTEREAQIIQRRADVHATLIGLQRSTSNGAVRCAEEKGAA